MGQIVSVHPKLGLHVGSYVRCEIESAGEIRQVFARARTRAAAAMYEYVGKKLPVVASVTETRRGRLHASSIHPTSRRFWKAR